MSETKTYSDVIKENAYQHMKFIHDCVDTGGVGRDITLSAGVETLYTCDGVQYEYKSVSSKSLFNKSTSVINDSIENSTLSVKLSFILHCSTSGKTCNIKIVIPHINGDIIVSQHTIPVSKDMSDLPFSYSTQIYTSSYSIDYGFKIYFISDATMTLKNRSILINN